MSGTKAPSAWQIERAFAALTQVRDRLLAEDATLPEDQRLWQDMIEGEAEGDPLAVIDRVIRAAIDAEMLADLAHVRKTELSEREARFKRRCEQFREVAFRLLDALEIRHRETPDFTAWIGAGRQRVIITDDTKLPESLVRVKREPALSLIAAGLKAGEQIEGAALANGGPSLTIRKS
jgi:hypothetical protein